MKSFAYLCFTALFLSVSSLPSFARTAPEFGPSLTWNTEGEDPSLAAMRGKSVLVFFYQDWCGICNGWSGRLFKQINDNLKDDPSTVLIAIKTDGGTMAEATAYLKERMDTGSWLIALDEGGAYYQQAAGNTSLYQHMWVKPDGTIEEIKKSSSGYDRPGGKEYVLGTSKTRDVLRKGTQVLFKDSDQMSPSLQPAIKMAEQGLFLSALKVGAKSDAEEKDLATFRTTLSEKVSQMISTHEKVVTEDGNEGRYASYLALEKLADGFGNSAQGKAARELVSAQARQPWISKEQNAFKDFQSIQRRAVRADDERSRDRVKRAFAKLAEEYPATYYGKLAAAAAK